MQNEAPLQSLMEVVQTEISTFNRVFIVIDALDECEEQVRGGICDLLSKLNDGKNVSCLITSRNLDTIAQEIGRHRRLEITAHSKDIETYIRQRISQSNSLGRHIKRQPSLVDEIISNVITKAGGM
jgi:ABC-type antimicrobial peptide transport system ATPase subunit